MASNLELHEINFRSLSHPGGDGVSGVCVLLGSDRSHSLMEFAT